MNQPKTTVLITGFGPFPGTKDNPSAVLVNHLAQENLAAARHDFRPVFEILLTDWRQMPSALLQAYNRHRPDLALHLGYAARAEGFQLETTGHNRTCEQPDIAGREGTGAPVIAGGPATLKTSLPVDELEKQLSARGLSVMHSDDAGRYLCNMAYYLALHHAPARKALFVHIPAIKTENGLFPKNHQGENHLDLAEAHKGLLAIIRALVN